MSSHPLDLQFVSAAGRGKAAQVRHWIERGQNPNAIVKAADAIDSALHSATRNGHRLVVVLLLQNGADPNLQAADLRTPLHLAPSVRIAHDLLQFGADTDALDRFCITPINAARSQRRSDVASALSQWKAGTQTPVPRSGTSLNEASGEDSSSPSRRLQSPGPSSPNLTSSVDRLFFTPLISYSPHVLPLSQPSPASFEGIGKRTGHRLGGPGLSLQELQHVTKACSMQKDRSQIMLGPMKRCDHQNSPVARSVHALHSCVSSCIDDTNK